jgi:hypothetical protein
MTKIMERQIAVSAVLISILAITSVVVIFSFPTRETYGTVVAAQQTPSKKILIVTTSHSVLGKTGYPTGLWFPEMTHPFYALYKVQLFCYLF